MQEKKQAAAKAPAKSEGKDAAPAKAPGPAESKDGVAAKTPGPGGGKDGALAAKAPVFTAEDEKELAEARQKLAKNPPRPPNPAIGETVTLDVTLTPDARSGDRELRLLTRGGLTNPMVFQVGQLPLKAFTEIIGGKMVRVITLGGDRLIGVAPGDKVVINPNQDNL